MKDFAFDALGLLLLVGLAFLVVPQTASWSDKALFVGVSSVVYGILCTVDFWKRSPTK